MITVPNFCTQYKASAVLGSKCNDTSLDIRAVRDIVSTCKLVAVSVLRRKIDSYRIAYVNAFSDKISFYREVFEMRRIHLAALAGHSRSDIHRRVRRNNISRL